MRLHERRAARRHLLALWDVQEMNGTLMLGDWIGIAILSHIPTAIIGALWVI